MHFNACLTMGDRLRGAGDVLEKEVLLRWLDVGYY